MKFNERLYQLRKKNGLTQTDVAERLGISRQAVSRWEIGVAVPTVEKLKELSELYGISLDYLMPSDSDTPDAGSQMINVNERTSNGEPTAGDSTSTFQLSQGAHLQDVDIPQHEAKTKGKNKGRVKLYVGIVVVTVLIAVLAVTWIYSRHAVLENKDGWLSQLDVDRNESQIGTDFQFE